MALKPVAVAKSRLGSLPDPLRRRLAWTMAVDTLTALAGAGASVLVVGDQPALASRLARAGVHARVVAEEGADGLNAALRRGAGLAQADGWGTVLAAVGDLPALRPHSVGVVLAAVAEGERGYLADATGVGTTLLVARGRPLDPHFSGPSAAAHAASGALPLTDERLGRPVPDARRDVDTEDDLAPATRLGLGTATRALLDAHGRLGRYTVITSTAATDDHGRALVITSTGHRLVLAPDALADGLRDLRPGQRLHGVHAGPVVLSAWL